MQIIVTPRQNNQRLPKVSQILSERLCTLAKRFKSQRGRGCTPFSMLPGYTLPLHGVAASMDNDAQLSFERYFNEFLRACDDMAQRSNAEITVQDMQSLTDYLVRLLDWQIFDSPRYLAPALVEEAIEVVRAVFGKQCHPDERQNLADELGDLLFMALWLSNVLAIPNPGHDIKNHYEDQYENNS